MYALIAILHLRHCTTIFNTELCMLFDPKLSAETKSFTNFNL